MQHWQARSAESAAHLSATSCSRVRGCLTIVQARSERADRNARIPNPPAAPTSNPAPATPKIPKRGFFSIADTGAEVYSKAGEKFDPTKKPGRYDPEFIWNTDWQESLAREESLLRSRERAAAAPPEQQGGYLSISRLSLLDDPTIDLSEQLRPRQKPADSTTSTIASTSADASSSKAGRAAPGGGAGVWSRKETAKLERVSRSAARGAAAAPSVTAADTAAEAAARAEEERARYEALKQESQLWTIAFGVVGYAVTYASYTADVATSYAVGALGGLLYLRLLGRSVDGLAPSGMAGMVGSVVGQQRLLVPVVLALGYNRWNLLASESTGVTLQLLPILVGFFTYKFAVVSRQAKDVLDAAVGKLEGTR